LKIKRFSYCADRFECLFLIYELIDIATLSNIHERKAKQYPLETATLSKYPY